MSDQLLQLYPPCELCQVRKKLQLFAGLKVCDSCLGHIRQSSPGLFAVNQSVYQDKD